MATRELQSSPRILPLYLRAAAPSLPGASLLPFIGGGGGEIPDIELVLRNASVDAGRLADYAQVCGFAATDELPVTAPHLLAFPLHLTLMADRSFPFGAIGLVHIANDITQHRPLGVREPLDLRVFATVLEDHPRGRSFSLITQARADGELVWEERSTMLRRGRAGRPTGAGAASGTSPTEQAPPPAEQEWSLTGDLGRRYAAVSGDRNPIHMHSLTAKPLGFPSAIAHGMWTKARCLAALEGRLPDAFTVTVRFRAPIALPSTVTFASVDDGEAIDFSVHGAKGSTPHLQGRVEPQAGQTDTNERSQTR
jgi:acyl dehydratase